MMRGLVQIFVFLVLSVLLVVQFPKDLLCFRPTVCSVRMPGVEFVQLTPSGLAAVLSRVRMPWQLQARMRLVGVPDERQIQPDMLVAEMLPEPIWEKRPADFSKLPDVPLMPLHLDPLFPPSRASPPLASLPMYLMASNDTDGVSRQAPGVKCQVPRLPEFPVLLDIIQGKDTMK